jgi:hypothetical protein
MNDLADMVEAAMSRYESGHARGLLESPDWLEVRSKAKELSAELEIKGKPVAATRVDREYVRLAEALRDAGAKNPPPKIKDDFALWDMSQEFLLTLRSLSRFQSEIDRQFRRSQVDQQRTSETKGLSRRAEVAWKDYQDAIGKGKFDNSPPTDREVWEWLLVHRRKGENLPHFETWQRYIREARNFHGCQKNTPRAGREFGGSISVQGDL